MNPYIKKDKKPPAAILAIKNAMTAVQKVKKVKIFMATFNFIWIFVIPHMYYGLVTKTLHFNLIF